MQFEPILEFFLGLYYDDSSPFLSALKIKKNIFSDTSS